MTTEQDTKAIELAFHAIGGRAHKKENCRCEPEVGLVPCEYCAIYQALEVAERLNKTDVMFKAELDPLKPKLRLAWAGDRWKLLGWPALDAWAIQRNPLWKAVAMDCHKKGIEDQGFAKLCCAVQLEQNESLRGTVVRYLERYGPLDLVFKLSPPTGAQPKKE